MLRDVDRYVRVNKARFSPTTLKTYEYHLRYLADWLDQAGCPMNALTMELVERFLEAHEWSPNTQRSSRAAIKSFWTWRYGEDCDLSKIRLPRDIPAPHRTLSFDQAGRLLSCFDTSTVIGRRDLAIACLMLDTGLRAAEVCRLRLKYLVLAERRFQVLGKGQKWRSGAFTAYTGSCLSVWLGARPDVVRAGVDTVFVGIGGSKPGSPMTTGGLRAVFRGWARRAGLSALSPHDLRRSFATLAIRAGAPTRLIQVAGGWEDLQMVERYTQALDPVDIEPYSPILRIMQG